MKNILLIVALAFTTSCHKTETNQTAPAPPPVITPTVTPVPVVTVTPTPVVHSNDSRLMSHKWSNYNVVITFTKDSMNYNTNAPVLLNSVQFNKSYTLHDTLYINSVSCYKLVFSKASDTVYLKYCSPLMPSSYGQSAGFIYKY